MMHLWHSARPYLWPIIVLNTVVVGTSTGATPWTAACLGVSLALLASFGFLLNDVADYRVDAVNKAGRLEAAGAGVKVMACMVGCLCGVSGVALAFWTVPRAAVPLTLIAIGLLAYALLLRPVFVVANLLAATLGTSPMWLPLVLWHGFQPEQWHWTLVASSFAVFVAREVVLDARDCPGDLFGRRLTLATVSSPQVALTVASILSLGSVAWLLVRAIQLGLHSTCSRPLPLLFGGAILCFLAVVPQLRLTIASRPSPWPLARYLTSSRLAMCLVPVAFVVDILW